MLLLVSFLSVLFIFIYFVCFFFSHKSCNAVMIITIKRKNTNNSNDMKKRKRKQMRNLFVMKLFHLIGLLYCNEFIPHLKVLIF